MGSFAAVAQGSHNEPRLIVLRYEPPGAATTSSSASSARRSPSTPAASRSRRPDYMDDMKGDMSGGGAVIEAHGRDRRARHPVRVLAVVASAENMASGHAFRPGDIVTALNGKTIEIINTDAEGRLVLADALWYAREQGATHLLDMATLTGAIVLAMGDLYAGRLRERRRLARRRSSTPPNAAATTPGGCRCTGATAATSTRTSPT